MRDLFQTRKMTEVEFFKNNIPVVKVTMNENNCFVIKKLDVELNLYFEAFETSSICTWDRVKKYVKSIIK